jgi:hypothetical protein
MEVTAASAALQALGLSRMLSTSPGARIRRFPAGASGYRERLAARAREGSTTIPPKGGLKVEKTTLGQTGGPLRVEFREIIWEKIA